MCKVLATILVLTLEALINSSKSIQMSFPLFHMTCFNSIFRLSQQVAVAYFSYYLFTRKMALPFSIIDIMGLLASSLHHIHVVTFC